MTMAIYHRLSLVDLPNDLRQVSEAKAEQFRAGDRQIRATLIMILTIL